MKITDVTTHVLGTPWRDLTYVQVHTDDGLVGVGETRTFRIMPRTRPVHDTRTRTR